MPTFVAKMLDYDVKTCVKKKNERKQSSLDLRVSFVVHAFCAHQTSIKFNTTNQDSMRCKPRDDVRRSTSTPTTTFDVFTSRRYTRAKKKAISKRFINTTARNVLLLISTQPRKGLFRVTAMFVRLLTCGHDVVSDCDDCRK